MTRLVIGGVVVGVLLANAGQHSTGVMVLGGGALVVMVLLGRARARLRTVGGRSIAIHTHGGHGTRTAAKHEAGHIAMTKRVGGTVTGAVIRPDGSGTTYLRLPRDISPADEIAVDVAGEVAAGSSAGCGGGFLGADPGSDHWHRDRKLKSLPPDQRSATKRAGYAKARSTVGGLIFDGGVAGYRDKLLRDGRL